MKPGFFYIGQTITIAEKFDRGGIIFSPGAKGVVLDIDDNEIQVKWEDHDMSIHEEVWWVYMKIVIKTPNWKVRLSE